MNHIPLTKTLLCCLALMFSNLSCQKREAHDPQALIDQHKAELQQLESQIHQQHDRIERWQLISLSLGAGCFVLLVVGAALGAKTRHDAGLHPDTSHFNPSFQAHVEP